MDNGDAVVNVGGGVSGDLTIETGGDPFSGTTAGGSTSVTILDGAASMHAVLPAGAFDQPVAFTISRTSDTPPEAGTAADGSPAQIDPILGYRFAFGIPTLNADANLTFTVDLVAARRGRARGPAERDRGRHRHDRRQGRRSGRRVPRLRAVPRRADAGGGRLRRRQRS